LIKSAGINADPLLLNRTDNVLPFVNKTNPTGPLITGQYYFYFDEAGEIIVPEPFVFVPTEESNFAFVARAGSNDVDFESKYQ
jgi:hypothetical protein